MLLHRPCLTASRNNAFFLSFVVTPSSNFSIPRDTKSCLVYVVSKKVFVAFGSKQHLVYRKNAGNVSEVRFRVMDLRVFFLQIASFPPRIFSFSTNFFPMDRVLIEDKRLEREEKEAFESILESTGRLQRIKRQRILLKEKTLKIAVKLEKEVLIVDTGSLVTEIDVQNFTFSSIDDLFQWDLVNFLDFDDFGGIVAINAKSFSNDI